MASRRFDVGQGALAWLVAGSLVMASACSSDSSVDFDPTLPSGGGETSSGGTQASSSGSGSGATETGGSTNGSAGEADAGTGNSAGSSATAGKNGGGQGGSTSDGGSTSAGTNGGGGKAGSASGGSAGAGGGSAGASGNAGTGGSAGSSGNGGTGGGGGNDDCTPATYAGRSYYFCGVVDSAAAAYAKCQSLGMSMLTIESMLENTFVIGKQKGQSWLGGSDELKEGEWRWASTGQVFWDGGPRAELGGNDGRVKGVYSNFIAGQPNNSNDDGFPENCLAINANGWNDLYCNLPDVRAACEATGPVILPKP